MHLSIPGGRPHSAALYRWMDARDALAQQPVKTYASMLV